MVRVKADAARTAGRFPRINRRNRAKSSVPLGYDEPTDDAGDSLSLSLSLSRLGRPMVALLLLRTVVKINCGFGRKSYHGRSERNFDPVR